MSLLEAFLALVILGFSAVGFLDIFRSGARSLQQASAWVRTVSLAESTMEAAALGDALQAQSAMPPQSDGYTSRVDVHPRQVRMSEVVVTVTAPDGTTFTVHKLVRAR